MRFYSNSPFYELTRSCAYYTKKETFYNHCNTSTILTTLLAIIRFINTQNQAGYVRHDILVGKHCSLKSLMSYYK